MAECYSLTGFRERFLSETRRLFSSRLRLDALVGLVFLRFFGAVATASISSRNFCKLSATLRPWSRKRWLVISNAPCLLILRKYFFSIRCLNASLMLGLSCTHHLNVTFVFSLLTFWPPGPGEREKLNSNSRKGIDISSLILNMTFNHFRLATGIKIGHDETARIWIRVDLKKHVRIGELQLMTNGRLRWTCF